VCAFYNGLPPCFRQALTDRCLPPDADVPSAAFKQEVLAWALRNRRVGEGSLVLLQRQHSLFRSLVAQWQLLQRLAPQDRALHQQIIGKRSQQSCAEWSM
jgi:hypothetical protein